MTKPLVSVIIPVYNSESYLLPLLESVGKQTYENIEIIIVNDGSTDGSGDICRAFAEDDKRVVLLEKENSGVISSRNCGLKVARGKYIQFADSDDLVLPEATAALADAAELTGCELVISDFYRVIDDKTYRKGNIRKNEYMSLRKYAEYMMKAPANFYYGVIWNKLFKADIIRDNNLYFEYGFSWGEDFVFILRYLEYVRTVMAIKQPTYSYYKRPLSLCSTVKIVKNNIPYMKKQLFEQYKELYMAIDLYNENKFKIQRYMISIARDGGKGDADEKLGDAVMKAVKPLIPKSVVKKTPEILKKTEKISKPPKKKK